MSWNVIYGSPIGALDTPSQPSAAALVLAGYAPGLIRGTVLQPNAASLVLAGYSPFNASYSTNFPATENPISENGNWARPATGSWTTSARSVGATAAFGDPTSAGFNDSLLVLVGSQYHWQRQRITGVVYLNGTPGSAEIELHARMSAVSSTSMNTYECDLIPNGMQFVKWTGTQGRFFILPFTNSTTGAYLGAATHPSDGDTIVFELFGDATTTTMTCKQNGTLIGQADDSNAISGSTPYTTGNPGMGFDVGAGGTFNAIGWKSYLAETFLS